MRKKCLASLLSLAILLSLVPTAAFAVEPEETEAVTAMETVDTSDADLPDNDELFAGYVQQLMYPNYGVSLFGITARERLKTDAEKEIYDDLKEKIQAIAAGRATDTRFSVDKSVWETDLDWTTVRGYLKNVTDALTLDCPYDLYWFDKTSEDGTPGGWYYTGSVLNDNVQAASVYFYVADAYQDKSATSTIVIQDQNVELRYFTTSVTATSAAANAVAKAKSIVTEVEQTATSDYDKLRAYKNAICDLVSYNQDAAGEEYDGGYGDPWQIIYVFDENTSTNVVCEGYAKAFQYLCDESKLTCYTVTGTMSGGTGEGPHMWNIVTLEGKNYLVDVTNCDGSSIGNPDKLFLKAPDQGGSAETGYTFTFDALNSISYTYDDDIKSLYGSSILTLNYTDYTPSVASVTIGETTTSYSNIDAVLSAVNGETAAIRLLADAEVTTFSINNPNTNITWYGGDYTLSTSSTNTVSLSQGTFTLESGTIKSTSGYAVSVGGGTFTMKGGCLEGTAGGLQVNGGTASLSSGTCSGLQAASGAVVSLSGGTFDFVHGDGTMSVGDLLAEGYGYQKTADDTWVTDTTVTSLTGPVRVAELAGLQGAEVEVTGSYTYNGNAQTPALTVSKDGKTLTIDQDYTVSYRQNEVNVTPMNAGTYEIVVTGLGAYSGVVTTTFTIQPQSIAGATVTLDKTSLPYNGSAQSVSVSSVTMDNKSLTEGTDYTVTSSTSGTNVGNYTVTVSGMNNYTGTATAQWAITKADQEALTIDSANTVTYGNTLTLATSGGSGTGAVTYTVTDGTGKATVSGSTLTPIQAGTVTVTATKAEDNNYNDVSVQKQITINQAAYAGTTAAAGSAKYGNTGTVDLSGLIVSGGTAALGAVTDGDSILEDTPAISGNVLTFTFKDDKDNVDKTATIPVSVTSANYNDYTITVTVTVNDKQTDTTTMKVNLNGWTYGTTANTPIVSGVSGGTVTFSYSGTGSTSYGPSAQAPAAAGTYQVTATCETIDTIYIATADFTIAKADPVIGTVSYLSTAPIYESTALNGINLSRSNNSVDGTLELKDGQILTVGTKNYLWIFTPADTANYNIIAGHVALTVSADTLMSISVSGTPVKKVYTYGEAFDLSGLTVTANYASGAKKNVTDQVTYGALAVGQTSVELSYQGKTCTVASITVNKANYTGANTAAGSAKYGTDGTVDLSGLIVSGGTAAVGTVTDGGSILDGTPAMNGNVLTFAFENDVDNVGKTATISVSVTSANYNTYTITVTVTVNDKLIPVVTVSAITVTYTGQPVPASAIKGAATYNGQTVPGTWIWTGGNAPATVKQSGAYSVTFTPNDTNTYTAVTQTVTVTISKAAPTGTPGYTAINTSGKTLADAQLTTGSISVPGTVKWNDADTTEVKVNASYRWTFTPDDTDNYNTLTGSIELWHRSSGSSSSSSNSGNKTETEKNPDGSTTTTVTNPNGTVTETTKNPDGSQEVIETKKDGTVTTTTTDKTGNKTEVVENPDGSSKTTVNNKDGSSSVTKVNENGKVEAQVTLPASVVENAEGEAVTLPIPEVRAASARDEAPVVTVDLPRNTSAKVEIPVRWATPGTVAVLVQADGTEKVIKTSITTDNGVTVTLSGGDTVKIVDNSREFADVPAFHWGSDYIDFVTSREIFSGIGANAFAPDLPMNRAMIVTVLAAYDGADTSSGGDTWYEAGQRWAMVNGISDGANMEQNLTREQLAVMLWSYAGRPSDGGSLADYSDMESVSSWAKQAMAWAVRNGLISGVDGALAPQGEATRVQVATILMRFVEKTV